MKKLYSSPLSVSLVWSLSDSKAVSPIIDVLRVALTRDKNKPFSRGLNVPLFLYSSLNGAVPPKGKPEDVASRNLVIVFTSVNTLGNKKWKQYVESLPEGRGFSIIPVAVDVSGLSHAGALLGLNCVRMYDWPKENIDLYAMVSLSHEIYRFGLLDLNSKEMGKASSITIFLSHAKAGDTGRLHSERIKSFIDNTNMNRFFDANEISPGYLFDEEIEKYINVGTLVAIESDSYSSRYWCQREILLAKEKNRPIIAVNCLEDYEDRVFPAASNVPCVHIDSSATISDKDILRILSSAIIETIRFGYALKSLEEYRRAGWIDSDCFLAARPPEIRQVIGVKKDGGDKICYPEPPIYSEEADWHRHMGVEAFTPLWNNNEKNLFSKVRVGLSISDARNDGYSSEHLHQESLVSLSQDLARHLLARSATLIYGGDLRPDGFTEFILDEARILNERVRDSEVHVENHLAWPLYVSEPEIIAWRARFNDVMTTLECDIPSDIDGAVDKAIFLPPDSPENLYFWSRCLTEMRVDSVSSSTARVCAGGKVSGYKGKMPGVLEEIVIAIEQGRPVFLLGGFGGIVKDVCDVLVDSEVPNTLTQDWQVAHNASYDEVQKIARERGRDAKYGEVIELLKNARICDLASLCGLESEEYERLMSSPFVDECVHIVLKGLRVISDGLQ